MTAPERQPYGAPEMAVSLPCQSCGARQVFTAIAAPGEREQPLYLRCCACGAERKDLAGCYGVQP